MLQFIFCAGFLIIYLHSFRLPARLLLYVFTVVLPQDA